MGSKNKYLPQNATVLQMKINTLCGTMPFEGRERVNFSCLSLSHWYQKNKSDLFFSYRRPALPRCSTRREQPVKPAGVEVTAGWLAQTGRC